MAELFSFPLDQVVTSHRLGSETPGSPGIVKAGFTRTDAGDAGLGSRPPFAVEGAINPDLSKQFVAFQLSSKVDGPGVLESSCVEPGIDGSEAEPDVLVRMEMLSFNLSESEKKSIEPSTRATMRINVGKDESSTDRRFDTAFWSIAAGLSLYSQAKGRPADGKDLKGDLPRAFGNRPIEVPGGLSRLTFEVVKHEDPPWWKQLFGFLRSGTGETLVSVLGFPAITNQAIDLIDQLLDKLTASKPTPLFKSLPMRLALSKYARDEFTGGNARIKMGCLRPGFCILARATDYKALNAADLAYYAAYGRLAPRSISEEALLSGAFDDPVKDVTYAVFRIGMKGTRLDPAFHYNA